jgi:hypothetical protein
LFIVLIAVEFTTVEVSSGPVLVARRKVEFLTRCGQYSPYYVSKVCKLSAKIGQGNSVITEGDKGT